MKNPILFMYQLLWKFSPSNRGKIILQSLMVVFANILDFFPPLIIAKILNIIQVSGLTSETQSSLLWLTASFIGVEVGFWLFHGPSRVMEHGTAFKASAFYKQYLIDGVMSLSAKWHTNHHSGDTMDKIEKASIGLKDFGSHTYEIIQALVRLVSSYLAIVYFNLDASYIVLFFIFITFTMILKFDNLLIKRLKKLNVFQNDITAKAYDIISNITTVIILRIENLVSKSIAKKLHLPYDYYKKTNKIIELKWFLVSISITFMLFSVMATYFLGAIRTETIIMIGSVSALFNYINRIGSIFYNFAYRYGDIVKWRTAISNVEEISKNFSGKEKKVVYSLKNGWKNIVIKQMNFSYEDEEGELHLENINITIKRKQRIALIGASGSGKTTMLKLLREMYKPQSGKVFVDGNRLSNDFTAISHEISLIPQEPEIFSTTIKENITLGLSKTLKDIKKYTDLAKFTTVLKRLPHGLDSMIVEKGVNLSGGEKQRLALARGLMFSVNKEIMLLDEPTSSVDAKNELAIYQNIFKSFKEKTIISSIHRLHLLPLFDKIYFFHKGKVRTFGTYKQLLKSSPSFKKMIEQYKKTKK